MVESVQARISKLREEMKKEQMTVIDEARKRRKRSRSGEAQKILLWEINRLRHVENKYMARIDRIMKEALGQLKPSKPRKMAAHGPMDKRPSQKARKFRFSK